MEDDIPKEENQPSTSKKESRRSSVHDIYTERVCNVGVSNSETSVSGTYSNRSRIDTADAQSDIHKANLLRRHIEPKTALRKIGGRRGPGRIEKRRRSAVRRQFRRTPKKRARARRERKERDLSVSSIVSRLSFSRTESRGHGCVYCGHHCCRRRYYEESRRHKRKKLPQRKRNEEDRVKKKPEPKPKTPRMSDTTNNPKELQQTAEMNENETNDTTMTKCIHFYEGISPGLELVQVGSRCPMLSRLFITNADTTTKPTAEVELAAPKTYTEVTIQMIYEGLRHLSVWRQEVTTLQLMDYMQRNYPVNPVRAELVIELTDKLKVAATAGIIVETIEDHWMLTPEMQKRSININHVTLFWRLYADTMTPFKKKIKQKRIEREDTGQNPDQTRDIV